MGSMSPKSLASWLFGAAVTLLLITATAIVLTLVLGPSAGSASPGPFRLWLPAVTVTLPAPTPTPVPNPTFQGEATYYYASGAGACSFDPSPEDMRVAAMNGAQYDNAALCGAYVRVSGPKGTVTVRIVDLCPGCDSGDLDLSAEAFSQIAELRQGRVPIAWQIVSPDLAGPLAYHFHTGSNQWWTAVQIRNHRHPVAKLEYRTEGGEWVAVSRTSWNYFTQSSPGMGVGPYDFRVTDSYGNVLVDYGVAHVAGGTVSGAGQFPPGP